MLDKPSRLTEKELAEAASKWAAEKLEKSEESSLPGISEFQVQYHFRFVFDTAGFVWILALLYFSASEYIWWKMCS